MLRYSVNVFLFVWSFLSRANYFSGHTIIRTWWLNYYADMNFYYYRHTVIKKRISFDEILLLWLIPQKVLCCIGIIQINTVLISVIIFVLNFSPHFLKSKLFFLVMRAYRVCVLPCACMYMRACIEELEYLLAALTDTRSHTGLLHKA